MSIILYDSKVAKKAISDEDSLGNALSTISQDVENIRKSLRFKIASRSQIASRLETVERQISEEAGKIRNLQTGLATVTTLYNQAEANISSSLSTTQQTQEACSNDTGSSKSEQDEFLKFFELLKSLLGIDNKTNSDSQSGLLKGLLAYIQSLSGFVIDDKRGLTGAEDLLDLGDKSIGLWTDLYDYLKKRYNGAGKAFSKGKQAAAGWLGAFGDSLGYIRAVFGAVDTINNSDGIGAYGTIGEILGTGDDFIDVWESVMKISDNTASGPYNPLMFYSTIAKSYVSAVAQGFSSYEKHAADGVWSVKDTAATSIESNVSGLYSMTESLTFGLISEKTTGISAEEISSSLENWAGGIGTKAGNYIKSNPNLYNAYQNSGVLGRTFITFFAAFNA